MTVSVKETVRATMRDAGEGPLPMVVELMEALTPTATNHVPEELRQELLASVAAAMESLR